MPVCKMGNRMDTKIKEDPCKFEVTETFVANFKHHIDLVDHSMSGLARVIDTMRATCEVLLPHVNKEDADAQAPNNIDGRSMLASHLILEMINTSVLDQKLVVMKSLSKFLHFVIELSDSYTDNSQVICTALELDKYMVQQTTSSGLSSESQHLQIPRLLEENIEIKKKYQNERSKVSALTKRDRLYVSEINDLKEQNEDLEKTLQLLKRKLEDEATTKENGDSELTKEIKKLRNTIKTLEGELEKERSDKEKTAEESQIKLEELSKKIKTLEHDQHLKKEMDFVEDQKKENDGQFQSLATELNEEIMTKRSVEKFNVLDKETQEIMEKTKTDEQSMLQIVANEASKVTNYEVKMDLDQNIQRLRTENETLKVTLEELKKSVTKLERLRRSNVIPVQMFFPRMFASSPAEEDLITLLKLKLEMANTNLKVVIMRRSDHLQTDIPLLVICNRMCYMWTRNDSRVFRHFNAAQVKVAATFHKSEDCNMVTEINASNTNSKLFGVFNFRHCQESDHFTLDDTTISEINAYITERVHGSAV